MEDRTKEYKAYINLASETLEFLYKLKKEGSSSVSDELFREVSTNICHFQERWATPMELPFGMGTDLKKPIEIIRNEDIMLELDCAIKNPTGDAPTFVVRESSSWKYLMENGKLENQEKTKITFANWMIDLFDILVQGKDKFPSLARSLASRWYYHASETDFEESDEPIDVADTAREKRAVVKAQNIINSLLFGTNIEEDGEDEEDDEDFEEEEDGEEEEEEEEEEDYSQISAEELKQRSEKAAALKLKGNEFFLANQMEGALDYYSQAIAICPTCEPYLKEKAVYYGNRSATLAKL